MNERILLKDLIRIPERVYQGDFVLKLTEGVRDAEATVRDYVVTPQLRVCFDQALGFIKDALESRSSKACYLHGSFGSGKSHFMAVLDLLLAGNLRARSIAELAEVVKSLNAWTEGRRFLMVPYHMIGAHDMESAILGQYADHVRALHPDAPVPGLYLAESLFEDARRLRAQLGDETFFAQLNEGAERDHAWGALEEGWNADSFESAMLETPEGEERQRLVGALIQRFFSSYGQVVAGRGEAFVNLDSGLAIMSQHAKRLGYDAVVLFLDELILWLATHAADAGFVAREGSKLAKLVEAQKSERPIPCVSFVARQRDLRELVGENLAGSLQLNFADTLKHWEARFHRITLEDRNLPVIAERRILKPISDSARRTLDAAFEEFAGSRRDVLETLLGSTGERVMFRQVYPFSPALVQALIAVSSVLQRERTALKLMLQLLVDRREELELGMLIPVGDLWDVISEGDEPFTDATRIQFENAKKLWAQKLLPLLERQHGVSWQDMRAGASDTQAAANLKNDARLLKTLLLAALVPEVESLKALTAPRLAALNHGSVRSPLPGGEARTVLTKLRQWAAEIGEIKITDDTNPVIAVQITGVDTEPILAYAQREDNLGNRRRKIRETLLTELGIGTTTDLFVEYAYTWRGTRRRVELVHDNVAELSDERLRGRGGRTVVVGLPFDEDSRRRASDALARLQSFEGRAETVVWQPSFLSDKAQRDLGKLVMIEHVLTGERFDEAARHLSVVDREQARAVLRNQQSQLQQRLRACLERTYGIADDPKDAVDAPLNPEDHLHSLDGTFQPQVPVGANLEEALQRLLDQLYAHCYPAHPEFELEIKGTVLKRVHEVLRQAIEAPDHRVLITDRATRQLVAGIATPLKLGAMGATHFVLEPHWRIHFERLHAQSSGPLTVARLREWSDQPRPMGLTREVQNLIIATYAEQTNRSFFQNGAAVQPGIDRLDDALELREQTLPSREAWDRARDRASALFGLTPPEVLNARNVAVLVATLRERAEAARAPLARFVPSLAVRLENCGRDPESADRLVTARSAQAVLAALEAAEGVEGISALANATIRTSETAMASAIAAAAPLERLLAEFDWASLEAVARLADQRRVSVEAIAARVGEALAADEHVQPLEPALRKERANALSLLAESPSQLLQPGPASEPKPEPPLPGDEIIAEGQVGGADSREARALLDDLSRKLEAEPDARLNFSWRLTRARR